MLTKCWQGSLIIKEHFIEILLYDYFYLILSFNIVKRILKKQTNYDMQFF